MFLRFYRNFIKSFYKSFYILSQSRQKPLLNYTTWWCKRGGLPVGTSFRTCSGSTPHMSRVNSAHVPALLRCCSGTLLIVFNFCCNRVGGVAMAGRGGWDFRKTTIKKAVHTLRTYGSKSVTQVVGVFVGTIAVGTIAVGISVGTTNGTYSARALVTFVGTIAVGRVTFHDFFNSAGFIIKWKLKYKTIPSASNAKKERHPLVSGFSVFVMLLHSSRSFAPVSNME